MSEASETTLADYLRTLRRYRTMIVLVTIACAGAALVYSVLQTPSYEATSSLSVRDPAQDLNLLGGAGYTGQTPLQLASAHAPQVTRSSVARKARKTLGSHQRLDQIRSLVDVQIDPNSYLVKVTGHSARAAEAPRIANAFARADAKLSDAEARRTYAAAARRLSAKIKGLKAAQSVGTQAIYADRLSSLQGLASVAAPVKVSDAAEVPSAPSSPKTATYTVAAAVFGFLLGIALAFGRGMLDHKLRKPGEVEDLFGFPIAAHLRPQALGHSGSPTDAEVRGSPLEPIDAEAFRRLRENLRHLTADRDLRTIAVTSAVPQEGKSTVAACLAMASAGAGTRTLLVECDLRKRVLAERLGIAAAPGLSDFLAGHASPQEILQMVPAPPPAAANGSSSNSLVCITAGSVPQRPADLLSSKRFRDFLAEVGEAYTQVIIDCPPLLPVADTLEIIPHVAGLLMCVRLNRATLDQARAARAALDRLPGRPAGLVVTDFIEQSTAAYRDYYYHEELATPVRGNRSNGAGPAGAPHQEAGAAPAGVAAYDHGDGDSGTA